VTDHGRTSQSQWSDVQQSSGHVGACQWLSSVKEPGLSCSSRLVMWQMRGPVSSLTQCPVSDERLNWRSQKKHDLQTLETCVSRLRSSANVTPTSPSKFGGNILIQSGDIDIFRNSIWRPPPCWIFMISKFGTFRHDGCLAVSWAVHQIWFRSLIITQNGPHICSRRSTDEVMH